VSPLASVNMAIHRINRYPWSTMVRIIALARARLPNYVAILWLLRPVLLQAHVTLNFSAPASHGPQHELSSVCSTAWRPQVYSIATPPLPRSLHGRSLHLRSRHRRSLHRRSLGRSRCCPLAMPPIPMNAADPDDAARSIAATSSLYCRRSLYCRSHHRHSLSLASPSLSLHFFACAGQRAACAMRAADACSRSQYTRAGARTTSSRSTATRSAADRSSADRSSLATVARSSTVARST
jgi:hypothetical protein